MSCVEQLSSRRTPCGSLRGGLAVCWLSGAYFGWRPATGRTSTPKAGGFGLDQGLGPLVSGHRGNLTSKASSA